MKVFSLFQGRRGDVGAINVTNDPLYSTVVATTNQIRSRFLEEPILRQPFLDLLTAIHHDDTEFPDALKDCNPVADHVSNHAKIQKFHHNLPTDADVVDFFTNAFPDVHMVSGELLPERGRTLSGRGEVDKEYISINRSFIQLWIKTRSEPGPVSLEALTFMFLSILIHEAAQSEVVWYGRGASDSPELGGIKQEGGKYVEGRLWDGVSDAEFTNNFGSNVIILEHVGITKDETFYPINAKIAQDILALDVSNGLPLLSISNLAPIPPMCGGRSRSKFMNAVDVVIQRPISKLHGRQSVQRGILTNDKVRIMPSEGG